MGFDNGPKAPYLPVFKPGGSGNDLELKTDQWHHAPITSPAR